MRDHIQEILDIKHGELCYLKQLMIFAPSEKLKEHYKKAFLEKSQEIEDFLEECKVKRMRRTVVPKENNFIQKESLRAFGPYREMAPMKTFTLEELAIYDGRGGRPAYVAINGRVYDITFESTWGGGSHFGIMAGRDVTKEFEGCHKDINVIERIPVVGVIEKK